MCIAITKNGSPCKIRSKGDYCNIHRVNDQPKVDHVKNYIQHQTNTSHLNDHEYKLYLLNKLYSNGFLSPLESITLKKYYITNWNIRHEMKLLCTDYNDLFIDNNPFENDSLNDEELFKKMIYIVIDKVDSFENKGKWSIIKNIILSKIKCYQFLIDAVKLTMLNHLLINKCIPPQRMDLLKNIETKLQNTKKEFHEQNIKNLQLNTLKKLPFISDDIINHVIANYL